MNGDLKTQETTTKEEITNTLNDIITSIEKTNIHTTKIIEEKKKDKEPKRKKMHNKYIQTREILEDKQIINEEQQISETGIRYILIGTTAINRPQLHSKNIRDWRKWINGVDPNKYKIKWFINIDVIDNLEISYEETEKNLIRVIKPNDENPNIELIFTKNPNNSGNFLKACQRVSDKIKKYVKNNSDANGHNTIVLWLEDDWKLAPEQTLPLQYIIETYLYLGGKIIINLTYIRNNYIHALAPSVSTYELWKPLFYDAWKNQGRHIDPEHCVGIYFNNKLGKEHEYIWNLTIITKHKNMTSRQFKKVKNQNPFDFPNSYYTYDEYDNVLVNKQQEELQLKKEQELINMNKEDINAVTSTMEQQNLILDTMENDDINSSNVEYASKIDSNTEIETTKETILQKTYVDNKYIPKENIMSYLRDKDFLKNEMVFMRITSGFCPAGVDYGRKFMKDNNLIKIKKQNKNQIDFYT
jgi:hypothetical protein